MYLFVCSSSVRLPQFVNEPQVLQAPVQSIHNTCNFLERFTYPSAYQVVRNGPYQQSLRDASVDVGRCQNSSKRLVKCIVRHVLQCTEDEWNESFAFPRAGTTKYFSIACRSFALIWNEELAMCLLYHTTCNHNNAQVHKCDLLKYNQLLSIRLYSGRLVSYVTRALYHLEITGHVLWTCAKTGIL